eukprot:gnl/TRDRNA2_/TRDRNA2_44383_c0_seq1.p1 gnl/TRDRNA2_/TRDRNA2_44383_c0~~gnl/TRDRNA2_/TRDRNA2_44383_c0_seq1.p1  ORF type:complete len:268 (+),score=71.59 gnl/TRDRNA2_/TRDRNA2_44383_c0_seq1:53-805(+)
MLDEKKEVEKWYADKRRALIQRLTKEQERANSDSEAKKLELQRSCEAEREAVKTIAEIEKKNQALNAALDHTVTQLNTARTELSQCQAEMEVKGLLPARGVAGDGGDALAWRRRGTVQHTIWNSELAKTLDKIEAFAQEKEQKAAEKQATKAAILQLQAQLNEQRKSTMKLEEFLENIVNPHSSYIVDKPLKREARLILDSSAKLRVSDRFEQTGDRSSRTPSRTQRPQPPTGGSPQRRRAASAPRRRRL